MQPQDKQTKQNICDLLVFLPLHQLGEYIWRTAILQLFRPSMLAWMNVSRRKSADLCMMRHSLQVRISRNCVSKIGSAPCRERGCHYVQIAGVACSFKKQKIRCN